MTHPIKGQCLCGSVKFETALPDHIDACHCSMCQKWAGSVFIGADYRKSDAVKILSDTDLTWYESSEWAKRGFCKVCGSSLFYRLKQVEDFWAVCAGSLNLPSGLSLNKEIFIDEKSDMFELSGDHDRLTGQEFFASLQSNS